MILGFLPRSYIELFERYGIDFEYMDIGFQTKNSNIGTNLIKSIKAKLKKKSFQEVFEEEGVMGFTYPHTDLFMLTSKRLINADYEKKLIPLFGNGTIICPGTVMGMYKKISNNVGNNSVYIGIYDKDDDKLIADKLLLEAYALDGIGKVDKKNFTVMNIIKKGGEVEKINSLEVGREVSYGENLVFEETLEKIKKILEDKGLVFYGQYKGGKEKIPEKILPCLVNK